MIRRYLGPLIGCLLGLLAMNLEAAGQARYFILVVWDGMRPDFVSPELTPTLWRLRDQGVWFANHHSVYPTSTEVNGTVLATGVFPEHSGLIANKEYRPEIDPLKPVGTEALGTVRKGDALTQDHYLRQSTLCEMLHGQGQRTVVVGAKPVALLQDRLPRGEESEGRVWFAEGALPEPWFDRLTNRFGPFPAAASPNVGRDRWATRCLTEAFWEHELPRYSVLWLSEPDLSQHRHGPGSPEALAAIRNCDQRLATLLSELDRRGVRDETDVVVVSDHGFSTIGAISNAAAALSAAGIHARGAWETPPSSGDVVVVGNGGSVLVSVVGHSPSLIQQVVECLQRQPFSGVLFTRDGLPGTFRLAEAKLAAPTAADVVLALRWSFESPARGKVFSDGYTDYTVGDGMHVTLSRMDLHNLGVACGPDFRQGVTDPLPSGNIDIVPTLLWLMGLEPALPLDGRILTEALTTSGPPLKTVLPGRLDAQIELPGGSWTQYLRYCEVNGVRYLEEVNGNWTPSTPHSVHVELRRRDGVPQTRRPGVR